VRRLVAALFTAARARFGGLVDFLWPTVAPWSEAKQAQEEAKQGRFALWDESLATGTLAQTPEQAAAAVTKSKELLDIQRARQASVESRMAGFLTLSSIGVSASLVGLAQQAYRTLGTSTGLTPQLTGYAAIFFIGYIFAQSTCLFLAALNGLKRRCYFEPIAAGLLPVPGDTPQTLARRQVRTYLACARDHNIRNSEKTDQMEIVHLALRNIAVGLTGLVAALGLLLLWKPGIQASSQSLVEILRSHHDLTEMLRGPQGPPGGPGPAGPPGVRGIPGHPCVPSETTHQHRKGKQHGTPRPGLTPKTSMGPAKGGSSVHTRTANTTIPLGLDAGGHDSIELKILWRTDRPRSARAPSACVPTPPVGQTG